MNTKIAKRLRREAQYDSKAKVSYVAITHKRWDGVLKKLVERLTLFVDPKCNRARYRDFKKAYREGLL